MGSHDRNHPHEHDNPSSPPQPPLPHPPPPPPPPESSAGINNNSTIASLISSKLESSPAVPASSSASTLAIKQHNADHTIVHHQHDENGRPKGEGEGRGGPAAPRGAAHQQRPASPLAEERRRSRGFSNASKVPRAGSKAAAVAAVSPAASVLRSPAAAAQVQRQQRRRSGKSRRRHAPAPAPAPATAPQLPGAEPVQARPTQPHAMAMLPSAHKAAKATAAALKASSKFRQQRRHGKSLASAPARASKATATADALSQPTVRSEIQAHESHQLANKPFKSSIKHHHSQHLLRGLSTNSSKLSPAPTYNNNNNDNNSYHNSTAPAPKAAPNNRMADQAVIDKLEAGFAKLQAATPEQCHSLLKKYLTREVLDQLKSRKTAMGATLLDVVQSGFENLDSGVGVYAPDAESYTLFAELFNPIIEDYHGGFKATDKHPASDFGDIESLVNVDPDNQYVISTRVRCGRSLKGYPFNPCLTEAQYKEMEDKVSGQFKEMDGDLAGTYYPLTGMTKEVQQQLIDDHFLFKEGDRFLQAANACRYWPTGRGIYHNKEKTFLVWVNEEDHLRIISMQKGGDLKTIFGRLVRGAKAIEAKVPFSRDERLGFLTFCPTNLGTTIRASVHIKLPKLAADRKKLEEVASKFNLQVRGTSGEHTESVGGVYDISNKRRLGLTEYQAVREMQDGILELIKIEKSL